MSARKSKNLKAPGRQALGLYRKPQSPWGWQLFQGPTKVIARTYRTADKTIMVLDSTDARVARARGNDNGGTWWWASSYYPIDTLEDMFLWQKGGVASLLYERVGGLLGCPNLHELGHIYIQIRAEGSDLSLVEDCLARIRVTLEAEVGYMQLIKTA